MYHQERKISQRNILKQNIKKHIKIKKAYHYAKHVKIEKYNLYLDMFCH